MRKVKFPFDLDVTDLVTPELKRKILPVGEKLKDFDKDRRERTKARRKVRKQVESSTTSTASSAPAAPAADTDDPPEPMLVDSAIDAAPVAGELPDEATKREEELAILTSLVDSDLEKDKGANVSGLYELVGIVSHKGASADGGVFFSLFPLLPILSVPTCSPPLTFLPPFPLLPSYLFYYDDQC
jgi:ubiquitin carboxyl-terminal hydrolase 14